MPSFEPPLFPSESPSRDGSKPHCPPPELTPAPFQKPQATTPTNNVSASPSIGSTLNVSKTPSTANFDHTDSPTYRGVVLPPPGPSGSSPPSEEDCEEVDPTPCILFAIKNCLSFKDPPNFHETQTCFFNEAVSENGELRRLLEEELEYHWNAIDDLKNMLVK
jgi:hypothetical protein